MSPLDLIGAVSYIQSIRQLKEGIEEVKVVTVRKTTSSDATIQRQYHDDVFLTSFVTILLFVYFSLV